MQCVNGSASQTSWTDQMDGPAGWISWTDQLNGPAGWTNWTDQLGGPAGWTRSFYLKLWPGRISEDLCFSLYIVAASESDEGLVFFLASPKLAARPRQMSIMNAMEQLIKLPYYHSSALRLYSSHLEVGRTGPLYHS